MEETSAAGVMLLATHYHHKQIQEYAKEVMMIIAAIAHVAAAPSPQEPPPHRTPELMAGVFQYLFAAVRFHSESVIIIPSRSPPGLIHSGRGGMPA
eukprot:1175877-Prorocentrum_minimum.AAC.1